MKLIIAGGGTGGHLFPGVAIAEEVKARDPEARVLFVGTARGIEARVLPASGWDLERIDVSGLKTVGVVGMIRGLVRLPRALWQSRRILGRFRPDAVVGVGGYASGPLVLAAWLGRIPTAVLEQNSVPGLANKILGKLVRAVFIAFDETRRFFSARRVVMTGTPIRAKLRRDLAATRGHDASAAFHLFCFGGSQGARAVSDLVIAAIKVLRRAGKSVTIVHQTGHEDRERVAELYAGAGIAADVRAFIDDMADRKSHV